jgi:Leucine-rich repeat (LRR) protein
MLESLKSSLVSLKSSLKSSERVQMILKLFYPNILQHMPNYMANHCQELLNINRIGNFENICFNFFDGENDPTTRIDGHLDEHSFACDASKTKLSKVQSLAFKNLNVNIIYPRVFSVFDNLTYLSLNKLGLLEIKAGAFEGLSHLRNLDLSCNSLERIEQGAFDPLVNLTSLNLFKNQLTDIMPDLFEVLTSIETLILDENPLSDSSKYALSKTISIVGKLFS